jgi:lactoylglutathione lyase
MARSVKFYRDALGLPLRFESPEWTEFATGSCNLALRKAAEESAQPVAVDRIPASHCHVGFTVTDLDEFHARITVQGIPCLEQPRGAEYGRVAVYADPDGLPVEVAQLAATGAAAS